MFETIREYGLELLSVSEEMEMTRQVHAAYYLVLAERAESELQGTHQALWEGWLEHEYDNLLAAWKWAIEQGKTGQRVEMVMRLYGVLHRIWFDLGHVYEGQSYYKRALFSLVFKQGDIVTAHALAKELRGQLGTSLWYAMLAQVAASQGDYTTVRSLYMTLVNKGGDNWVTIPFLESLADVVAERGDATWAARLWGSAEALRETTGTPVWPHERARYERMVAAARK
jgi:hypothetical protein